MQKIHISSRYYDGIKEHYVEHIILPGAHLITLGKAMLIFDGGKILPVFIVGLSLSVAQGSDLDLLRSFERTSCELSINLSTKITILNDFDFNSASQTG